MSPFSIAMLVYRSVPIRMMYFYGKSIGKLYNFPMDPMPGVYTEIQKQLKLADQIQSASNSARPVFFMSGQPDPP